MESLITLLTGSGSVIAGMSQQTLALVVFVTSFFKSDSNFGNTKKQLLSVALYEKEHTLSKKLINYQYFVRIFIK